MSATQTESNAVQVVAPGVRSAPAAPSTTRAASDRPRDVLPFDRPIIVTIDGPAGTGKSSVARTLAARLGLDFLDTGAMYRAAAAIVIDQRIPTTDVDAVVAAMMHADLHFDWSADPPEILAFGQSVAARIRDADVTSIVSPIAGIARLREVMVAKQRIIGRQHPRLVTEGRDQGSVVFPNADVKFYLDATPEVRAARRSAQLRTLGQNPDESALHREIIDRDRSDSSRAVGPLICPTDAITIDTSANSFEQVVVRLETLVRERVRA